MVRYKRSFFVFFSFHDKKTFDLEAFLRGKVQFDGRLEVQAWSVLTGAHSPLTRGELGLLARIGGEWQDIEETDVAPEILEDWVRSGLVLSDSDDEVAQRLRGDEETLLQHQWHPIAALYHFMVRGSEEEAETEVEIADIENVAQASADSAAALIERFGPPPAAFHEVEHPVRKHELPPAEKDHPLYSVLHQRHTLRTFDGTRKLPLNKLSTLLFHTFGCRGYTRVSDQLTILQKSSPSGGSMHPVEAYPLILRVEGLEPGFYHYNVEHHRLDLVRTLKLQDAALLAEQATNGQGFVGSSHVAVFLTARFYRNFWKYRRTLRTYSVVLMDAAHLSQTFYLVATELDLGAYYTASVSPRRVEKHLGIDPAEEGVLGVCGCGIKPPDGGLRLERVAFDKESADHNGA